MALGPAAYDVYLQSRGGHHQVAKLPWTDLSWGRRLDDMSAASVTVPVTTKTKPGLAASLAKAQAWEHEISIWRGGTEVWVGPLVEPTWTDEGVVLAARDLTQWWERRVLAIDRDFADVDLGSIFATLANDAMVRDPSPNIIVNPHVTGVLGTRSVKASDRRRAADELRELARTGLDYVAIARHILIGGPSVPALRLPNVLGSAVTKPQLKGAGLLAASEVTILAGQSQSPIVATRGGVGSETGLVQRSFSETTVLDAGSAQAAAITRFDALSPAPLYLTVTLRPRSWPGFDRLVPGAVALVQMAVGVREIDGDLRLSAVGVTASVGDAGITETVTVDFIPLGTVDGEIIIGKSHAAMLPATVPSIPAPPAALVLTPSSWFADVDVQASGSHFSRSKPITVSFDSPPGTIASPTSDTHGAFPNTPAHIPAGAAVGAHTVSATDGTHTATAPFNVVASPPPPPPPPPAPPGPPPPPPAPPGPPPPPSPPPSGTMSIINQSSLDAGTAQQIATAINQQFQSDFNPAWNTSFTIDYGGTGWPIYIRNSLSCGGQCGGQHGAGPQGEVLWAGNATQTAIAASHEAVEMASDPDTQTTTAQQPNGYFYYLECADIVVRGSYTIGGVPVSDFATPAWFGMGGGSSFDHLGLVNAAFHIDPNGGYAVVKTCAGCSPMIVQG